jgi:hypothetical protein
MRRGFRGNIRFGGAGKFWRPWRPWRSPLNAKPPRRCDACAAGAARNDLTEAKARVGVWWSRRQAGDTVAKERPGAAGNPWESDMNIDHIGKAALTGAMCCVFYLLQPSLARAEVKTGKVVLTLQYAYGLEQTGGRMPSKDAYCKANGEGVLGQRVQTEYSVDTATLMEKATSTFIDQTPPKVYELHPLGLANQYAFGRYMRGAPLYAVLFSTSLQFTGDTSSAVILHEDFNCLYSSKENALEGGLKSRLGTGK